MEPGLTQGEYPSTWQILGDPCSLPFHGGNFCKTFVAPARPFFLLLFYSRYGEWGSDSAHVFPITTKKGPGTNPKCSALPGKRERNPTRNTPKVEKDSDPIPALLVPSGFSCPAAPPALWDLQPCAPCPSQPQALPLPLPSRAGHCCVSFGSN